MTLEEIQAERRKLAETQREVQRQIADAAPGSQEQAAFKARLMELQHQQTLLGAQDRHLRAARAGHQQAQAQLEYLTPRALSLEKQVESLRAQIHAAAEEKETLLARVEAGIFRRQRMLWCLNAFLTCEDDTSLTEDEYDARMAEVERQARTLVSLEQRQVLRAQGGK